MFTERLKEQKSKLEYECSGRVAAPRQSNLMPLPGPLGTWGCRTNAHVWPPHYWGSCPYLPHPTRYGGCLRGGLDDLLQDGDIGLNLQKILSGKERVLIKT